MEQPINDQLPGQPTDPRQPLPSMDDAALLEQLSKDFRRLKQQKARKGGGVEARTLLAIAFDDGEQHATYVDRTLATKPLQEAEKNQLRLVFNLIQPRRRKLIGRLSSNSMVFKAVSDTQDPKALGEAEVVDKLIVALDQKLDQPSREREIWEWLTIAGTAFEYTPWVPNATVEPMPVLDEQQQPQYTFLPTKEVVGQAQMDQAVEAGSPPEQFELLEEVQIAGEVGSEILGPLNVFIDQGAKSVGELAPDQWVHIARIKTTGWISETYGVDLPGSKDLSIISSSIKQEAPDTLAGTALADLLPVVQGSASDDDPPMEIVVDSYAPASAKYPHGRFVAFVPGKQILVNNPNPYDEVPLVDFHWQPVTKTFWTPGYVDGLIPPQKFINKRLSQLGEQSNATLYSPLLLGPGLGPADVPADFLGMVKNGLTDAGVPLVQRMPPPQFPAYFMPSLELVIQLFNDKAGGAGLMEESKFPGQLRGPMAVPMLQEILDSEWGPLFTHMGERLAKVKQMRLNRVKQFYPASRTLHYTNKLLKEETLDFNADATLRTGNNYKVRVERGSMLPELRALREARVIERLNSPLSILYIDERTGRFDKGKIAADLHMGDASREGREAQYRKLAGQIIARMWRAEAVPPVLPFYDHAAMMDELESAMATEEFLHSSPAVIQLFSSRWEEHRQYMVQEAQQQQMAMQSGMVQGAVAQATQQAAAMTASKTVEAVMGQMMEQAKQPTKELVQSAVQAEGAAPRAS